MRPTNRPRLPRLAPTLVALAALVGFSATPGLGRSDDHELGDLTEVREAFQKNEATLRAHSDSDPVRLAASRTALGELFMAGSLDQIHALLKDGTIDPELSKALAEVRNGMVDEVRRSMAIDAGEVHVTNFSPATNLLNDIDQTFRPSERLAEEGTPQNGSELKVEFQRRFFERFQIAPEVMDVVSHTSEAGIPDWRKSEEVHDFVANLRKGSRMLSDNPEAYYLEGAFRMQVERRSFESDQKLYSIYTYAPGVDGDTARVDTVVERSDGTIRDIAFKGLAPEARRSYSAGSTVGNFWFMTQHGGGTRYCAKYGLRSFSEGPGWLEIYADAEPGDRPQPLEFEKIEAWSERQAYFDKVYLAHFRDSEMSRQEVWNTLETARVVRNAGDQFRPEMAFEKRAIELAGGSEAAYRRNQAELLAQADLEFRNSMTQLMIRNMEVTLPERLGDWVDPRIDPRHIGLKAEDIEGKTDHYHEEMAKARKRLRTAALFECMHSLRVLEPELRERVLNSAIENLKRKAGTAAGERYPFERAIRAVGRLAGAHHRPRLMELDDERARKRRYSVGEGVIFVVDDEAGRVVDTPPLTEQVDLVRSELAEALRASGLDAEGRPTTAGALQSALNDAVWSWERAVAEAEDNLRTRAGMFDPTDLAYAERAWRRTLWDSLGYEAEADWSGLKGQDPDYDPATMEFNGEKLYQSVVNWGNAQSVLNIVQAYRKGGANKAEAVRGALLMEFVGRIPYVGDALQVQGILEGKEEPILGTTLMIAGFVYPGVGQAMVVYGVVSGSYQLAMEIAIEGWVQLEYQGRVLNDDGTPGPGATPELGIWKDTPGVLEPVARWMGEQHRALTRERANAEPDRRQEIDYLLKTLFLTSSPRVSESRRGVYAYFAPQLHATFERAGHPESEWDALELEPYGPTIRSNEEAELFNPSDLPPLVRAFMRPLVRDYVSGTGDFAKLEAHADAHAHPVMVRQYFPTRGGGRAALEEDLVTVLTAAYVRSLRAHERGEDTTLRYDRRWDRMSVASAIAYLDGIPAKNLAGLANQHPTAGPLPDVPSILDFLGPGTSSEQRARFFGKIDAELDTRLRAYHQKHDRLPPSEWTAFKLGEHHPSLRPEAAENRPVAHPLLLAFFNKRVHDTWEDLIAVVEPPSNGGSFTTDDGFILDAPDTGSVGASETTTGVVDPWRGAQMEAEIADSDRRRIQAGVVQQLIVDYKQGRAREIADRRNRIRHARLAAQLPAASALGKLGDAVWGDRSAPVDAARPLGTELAAHVFVPNLFPDETFVTNLDQAFRAIPDEVEIEITGTPKTPVGPDESLDVDCVVRASDVHWERPYRVEWKLAGAETRDQAGEHSEILREHELALQVGDETDGIPDRELTLVATVTDATGRAMGEASTTFRVSADPSEEPEAEEDLAGADWGDGEIDDEGEEEPPEFVAYIIAVEGSGWIPHYAGGSYITTGMNEQVLWVPYGESPQRYLDELRDELDHDPCKVEIPAIPGLHKRPVVWTSGPMLSGVEGPILDSSELFGREYASTWSFSDQDGPSLSKIREMNGCN